MVYDFVKEYESVPYAAYLKWGRPSLLKILYLRCLCDTLSKALAKFIIMRSVWMFLSDDLARS